MSSLSTISVNRPVLAIVMNLVILIFGYLGFQSLGVREFPSIDPPIVNVRTNYPGANADIIESQITEPLEKAINGIAGITNISSSSNQGSSNITVEFSLDTNLEEAANDVRDKVSQSLRQLPPDLDGVPVVSKADANSDAIVSLTVRSNNRSHLELSDYAENVLSPRLQTIPGVSTIQIWGQKKFAMRLWLDPFKLSSYGLTALDVRNALARQNVELPGGKIAGNDTELTIKTYGRITTEKEFNDLVIKSLADGQDIRLNDVGYAVLGPENEETILRGSNIPMIGLAVVPQPGSNYLDISDEFYRRLQQIEKEVPDDILLDIALDNTSFIRKSINEVKETFLIALVLVILIIYFFFRNWAIAFRPLIDIPVSLLGSFFVMYVLGYSINVLTLLAIILATGLVVDDGIVVTENIFKKIEKGMNPKQAAIDGSREIFFAVISTSITLAAVFMPVIFLEGFVGALFREFGIVLASAVLISAFVSLSLTPMLNAYLSKKTDNKGWFYQATEPFFVGLDRNYRNALRNFLDNRWMAFVIIIICFGMVYFFNSVLKTELSPLEDRNAIRLQVQAPEGSSFEFTDRIIQDLVAVLTDSIPEHSVMLSVTAPGFIGSGAANTGFVRIRLKDAELREKTQQQIATLATKLSRKYTDARIFVIQDQTISSGGRRGGLPVAFVIQAPTFEKLKAVLPEFVNRAEKHPNLQGVDVNLKFNKPELYVTIDRDKTKVLGLSIADVAQVLQTAFSGQRFGYFIMNGKQYQVIGQFDRANRDAPIDLKSVYIRNSTGEIIQLDNIAKVEELSSPPQLYHFNLYQAATVSAGLPPGKTIADGIAAMEEISADLLDESFSTSLTGASKDFAESSSNIIFAFILALLLVYLVLSAQFESFIDPFIIMFTVPLALAGALFALWYFNQTLNIFSQIGIIMLIGLVTKNGILIVEFANQIRERGASKSEAIMEGAVSRLRPILMTSLATALGALPIAIAFGAGSESRKGMGIVIVGGIMFSLILTLFVIPALYSYLSRKKDVIMPKTFDNYDA
ncbi:MAG: efflux RND transporter permease subunit [Saprospiraceae bacterium]|nr:efflux RND transporter permease subunit [Saprospiraceae bacterium]